MKILLVNLLRFHPVYKNHLFLTNTNTMDVFFDRETIYIDLQRSEEEIMKQYHKNHKRNLKKALKHPLEFKLFTKEEALKQVDKFYHLYKETMNKLSASEYSYFSTDYLESLLSQLDYNSMISAAFLEGKMVSAALCMFTGNVLHYHLGCSKKEFLHLGVNVFLFHHIAMWAKKQGFHVFHLGGGHVGRDSLFQFKHRFHSMGILDFYIGRKIHHQSTYDVLVSSWEKYYVQQTTSGFFPAYRMKPLDKILTEHS